MEIGFSNEKYVELQSRYILERIEKFGDKLYLEFGGKLYDDLHASRVLPGFRPDVKVSLLEAVKHKLEVIFCIYAGDIERNKVRADYGITYDMDVLRLIDRLRDLSIYVSSVVITRYDGQPASQQFAAKLESLGIRTYLHKKTKGYPTDIDTIVSDEGYGANPYIETTRPLVVVTGPGPGSGKLATCLSQLYHEQKRGIRAGYAKFETFPIWNLSLKHPVNLAYEAATADLGDVNMIDPFHLDAYGVATVNYNRDVEVFPVVRAILSKITGKDDLYRSPTDMGVNMAGNAIIDDEVCSLASKKEILRRWYKAKCDERCGNCTAEVPSRIEMLISELKISRELRPCIAAAKEKAERHGSPAVAIELPDGSLCKGRKKELMSATAAAVLNSLKHLAGLSHDNVFLISPEVLEPLLKLKKEVLDSHSKVLTGEEVLMALSICAVTNPYAKAALDQLPKLRGTEAHSSVILPSAEEQFYRKLGIHLTTEPIFEVH